jgi:hypothetical protein
MERVMQGSLQEQIQEANATLSTFLFEAREALDGRRTFTGEEIRAISKPLGQIQPILSQILGLRATDSALSASLATYEKTLTELQATVEQLRFMLLARQGQLGAARSHFEAVNLWVAAFKQTE